VQGQCKPNAESSLYAEVQPVLAFSNAKFGKANRRKKERKFQQNFQFRQMPIYKEKEVLFSTP